MQRNKMNTMGPDLGSRIVYDSNLKEVEAEKYNSNLSTVYYVSSLKNLPNKTQNSTNAKESYVSTENQFLTLNHSQKKFSTINFSSANNLASGTLIDYEDEKYNKFPYRKDRRGVPIIKGGKRHRVTFADEKLVSSILVERIKVESFKIENLENSYSEDKPNSSSQNCCVVF